MDNIEISKFNIMILGEMSVGKSSICQVHVKLVFDKYMLPTIGVENFTKKKIIDGKEYTFKIFDTAGEEKYKSISTNAINICTGFILVFDVTKADTFHKIESWVNTISDNVALEDKVIYLVGNKIDLENREVSEGQAKIYAIQNNFKYFEASAKEQKNINEIFDQLYMDVYNLSKKSNKVNDSIRLNFENFKEKKNKKGCCSHN